MYACMCLGEFIYLYQHKRMSKHLENKILYSKKQQEISFMLFFTRKILCHSK